MSAKQTNTKPRVLSVDEFNSLMENATSLMAAVRTDMRMTASELRQMADDGKLTTAHIEASIKALARRLPPGNFNQWRLGDESLQQPDPKAIGRDLDLAATLLFSLSPFQGTEHLGKRVRKKSGAAWSGRVVGWYSTQLTPRGYAVESDAHPGSVQIYPEAALEFVDIER